MLLIYLRAQGQPSRDDLEKQLNLERQKRMEAEKMRTEEEKMRMEERQEAELRIQALQVGVVERVTLWA